MERAKKSSVPALERGLAVLEAVGKSRGGLTLSQLSRYLDVPKSSVLCLLRTLEASSYVYREVETGRYRISLHVCTLAQMALNGVGIREQARPHLRRLSESTGMTVHLAVLELGACVLIEKVSPPAARRVATFVGKHLSLHCTALGKALSAYLPEEQLETLIREQGLLRHNDNTIGSMKRLKTELAAIRERGYAVDDEEEEIGVRCLGAPIFNGRGEVVAALSVVASTGELHSGNVESVAQQVLRAAAGIPGTVREPPGDASGGLQLADPAAAEELPAQK